MAKKSDKKAKVSVESTGVEPTKSTVSPLEVLRVTFDGMRDTRINSPEHGRELAGVVRKALVTAGVTLTHTLNADAFGLGMRVEGFQNALYALNERDGWKFNDHLLAIGWAVGLPANDARVGKGMGFTSDPAKYVGGTRTLYNKKKHGAMPTGYDFVASNGRQPARTAQPAPAPAEPQKTEPVAA